MAWVPLRTICICTLVVLACNVNASAVDQVIGQPFENAGSAALPTSAEIIPSLVHKGEITEYLQLLGKTCHKNIIPSPKVKGLVHVNLFDVTWRQALDAVLKVNGFAYDEQDDFIFVYTQAEYEKAQAAQRRMESRTFELSYISGKDLTTLVQPLLSENGRLSATPEVTTTGEGEMWAGDKLIVVVDYPERIEQVASVIEEADRRPAQVLVEATILVASLDDKNELGVDFSVLGGINFQANAGFVGGIPTGMVGISSTETSVNNTLPFTNNVSNGGVSVGIVKDNIGVFVKALESVTDIMTLGNPKILTLNRQYGQVKVGDEDGYVTSTIENGVVSQKVDFLETGTQLNFRPFVMSDGYIRMEIHPEDSDGGVTIESGFTLPWKATAEVTSNILVKDGQTIVIGGLFRDRVSATRSQVPILGDLPLLGPLFRSNIDQGTREEVIFLITPHIVKDDAEYAAAGKQVHQKCDRMISGLRDGMDPTARDTIAERHYQNARDCYDAGDTDKAMAQLERALEISPGFLDALRLRDDLLGTDNGGEPVQYGSMKSFMRDLIEEQAADQSH